MLSCVKLCRLLPRRYYVHSKKECKLYDVMSSLLLVSDMAREQPSPPAPPPLLREPGVPVASQGVPVVSLAVQSFTFRSREVHAYYPPMCYSAL